MRFRIVNMKIPAVVYGLYLFETNLTKRDYLAIAAKLRYYANLDGFSNRGKTAVLRQSGRRFLAGCLFNYRKRYGTKQTEKKRKTRATKKIYIRQKDKSALPSKRYWFPD